MLQQVITNIIGTYAPVINSVTGEIAVGMAGVDWSYVIRAEIFSITLFSVLMIIGGILKRL